MFGVSPLNIRGGSIVAAAVFIGSAYWLCRMLSRDWIFRFALFMCLVYNPFVFDYFVAARGYGLGLAFLLLAIKVGTWSHVDGDPLTGCAVASVCAGLAFSENFGFAFAVASLLAMLSVWAWMDPRGARRPLHLIAATILPALAIVVLIPSSILLAYEKSQIVAGTASLREMFVEMIKATLDGINPNIVNPLLLRGIDKIRRFLIPLFWIAVVLQISMIWRIRKFSSKGDRLRLGVLFVTSGAAGLALLLHWIAFKSFGLLLPVNRTSVFFAPLVTVMAGAAISIPMSSRATKIIRRVAVSVMCVMGVYFFGCMRLRYFHEWAYISEARDAYNVAAYYNHTRCAQALYPSWYYEAALEFYRRLSPKERFDPFVHHKPEADWQIYVLNSVFERGVIESRKLTEVYHGAYTDIAVYLPPSTLQAPEKACDAALLP